MVDVKPSTRPATVKPGSGQVLQTLSPSKLLLKMHWAALWSIAYIIPSPIVHRRKGIEFHPQPSRVPTQKIVLEVSGVNSSVVFSINQKNREICMEGMVQIQSL